MKRNSPFILYTMFLVGVLIHSFVPMTDMLPLQIVKLLLGLTALILIPGIYITNLLNKDAIKNLAFAFIFGFLLQLLNVYAIWWLYTVTGEMSFVNSLYLMTAVFTLILMPITVKLRKEIKYDMFLKKDLFLIAPLVICIGIVLFYPGFDAAFHSDGGAYLDLARGVVTDNVFSSHIIHSPNSWAEAQWSTGMIDHFFGYSAIAVFFALGNVSLLMAKFMLLFVGSLTIFPLYAISAKLFNCQVARIAVFLTSISPIILYHLRLIGGPEVTSLLFTLVTLYLFLTMIGEKFPKLQLCLLSGMALFVAWYAWLLNGYIFVLYLPLLFLLSGSKSNNKSSKLGFLALLFLVFCFFIDFFVMGHVTSRYLGLPLPLTSIALSLVIYKLQHKLMLPNFYLIFLTTSLCLVFFASYMPRLVSYPFIQFDALSFPTGQMQITANAAQTLDILRRALDLGRVTNVANWYLFGKSFAWDGVFNSIGILTIFLAIASFARLNKLKETLLVFAFPMVQMTLWILMSPTDVVLQPRYLLSTAPFYFILAASTIELVISSASSPKLSSLKIRISTIWSFSLNAFDNVLVGILLVSILLALCQPIYANLSQNGNYWDYNQKYNWNDAIAWVNSNTTSKDVLAFVYADCFVWYTNRETVFLWDLDSNANLSTLIGLIRDLKVNYLVVDKPFSSQFSNLKGLYESPKPFLGSTIVFMNQNTTGGNVIIYNVTNITYGSLLKLEFEPDWEKLENWQPLTFYSTGNVSTDQDAVRFDLKVADTPWPSGASTFTFSSPANLSQYSSVEFWIMVPESTQIVLEMYPGTDGQNYFSYVNKNTEYNEWSRVVFDLSNSYGIVGKPSLQNVTKLNFIVGGMTIGEAVSFCVKDISFYKETYSLNSG
jgi:hypothetical protein